MAIHGKSYGVSLREGDKFHGNPILTGGVYLVENQMPPAWAATHLYIVPHN